MAVLPLNATSFRTYRKKTNDVTVKELLHESSISPFLSCWSVSSSLSQTHISVSSPTSKHSGEFVLPTIVQQHTSVSSPTSGYSGDFVPPSIVQQHTYLSTPTSQHCESPKNTKTHWMKDIIAFKQEQNDALTKRLDKLEEREGEMLRVQQQLVVKLEEANDIGKQKLELFRTMFSGVRGRLVYLDGNGYTYVQNHTSTNRRQLRCTRYERGCLATASMALEPENAPIIMYSGHNHRTGHNVEIGNFLATLRSRGAAESSLEYLIGTESIFGGLVFANLQFLQNYAPFMRQSTVVAVDGTFGVLPRSPSDMDQLVTIHVLLDNIVRRSVLTSRDTNNKLLEGAHQNVRNG
ncbi:hypothetical protein ACI65C_006566 [Semiaphis heraclei]